MSNLKGDHISCASSIPSNAINHWNDDFVQSMETPYGASEYHERAETLVKEVKILLREMQSGDGDLIERLEMVDALQCLGIDRYFTAEIKAALDYVYRSWDGSAGIGLGCESSTRNLNATALGLRVLRLNRYDVSADVLENFKDNKGQFIFCGKSDDINENNIKEEYVMRIMLNLLRVSSVGYSGEIVMEEAKAFSTAYLNKLLEKSEDIHNKSFLKEVEYALIYEWPRTFSRWEARNFIEIYELDNMRLKDKKILELAKLDFNMLQFEYKLEMKNLSSWWVDSGISKLVAVRERSIEYFFWAVSSIDEVDLCSSRISMAKITTVVTIMDDFFDDYATLEQLKCITEAIVQGWNISIIKNIPNNLRTCLEFVFKTVHELTSEATKKQGRDMMPFVTKAWADYTKACFEQARWKISGYIPTYHEYIKIAEICVAFGPILLHTTLLASHILCDVDIEKIFLNKSRFYQLMRVSMRLVDDIHDFEDERLHGKTASAISCYMRDHLDCSEGDALNHIIKLNTKLLKEIIKEFLKPNNIFLDWEKICVNSTRGVQFFYIFGDGFTYCQKEIKHQIFKVLIEPVEV
uniref:Cedrol synthase n=1 Tax=Taiwania cryptomerioides TaxID=50187 RepID=A0A6C0TL59_TAICR|nr:cedrol synthase [Taiwania cryptomerioides]